MGRASSSLSLPLRRECKTHVYETITEPMPFEVPPFFVVATKCLVCDDVLPALEVDSFYRATPEDWAICIAAVRREADRLNAMVVILNDRAAGRRKVLRDFG